MKKSKMTQMHYMPRTYMKSWEGVNRQVRYWDPLQERNDGRPHQRSTKSIMKMAGWNWIDFLCPKSKMDDEIEEFVENEWLYILEWAETGKLKQKWKNRDYMLRIALMACYLWRNSPEGRQRTEQRLLNELKILRNMWREGKQKKKKETTIESILRSLLFKGVLTQDKIAAIIHYTLGMEAQTYYTRDWEIWSTRSDRHELITSGSPLVHWEGSNCISVWFPMSRRIGIFISDWTGSMRDVRIKDKKVVAGRLRRRIVGHDEVDLVNLRMAMRAMRTNEKIFFLNCEAGSRRAMQEAIKLDVRGNLYPPV